MQITFNIWFGYFDSLVYLFNGISTVYGLFNAEIDLFLNV